MKTFEIIHFFITLMLLIVISSLFYVSYTIKDTRFTTKDWIVIYELCNKKSWYQTNNILKMYWSDETLFKNYLLKIK